MLKQLLVASALLLPNVALAQYVGENDDGYDYSDYTNDDSISIDLQFLTPTERGELAVLQAKAEKRFELWVARLQAESKKELAREAIKAEREAARRQ